MTAFTLAEIQERTYKKRDAWWTVFLVDPLAGRLVVWTANHTSITPNQLTFGAGLLGLGAAACFTQATWPWLVAGALLFHLSFVLDCMDGKIARLKGTGTVFGAWVDFVFDRIRFFACMMALLLGQWVHTGEIAYLLLAPLLTFFDLLRYLNGTQIAKTRRTMRRRLNALLGQQNDQPEQSENEPGAAEDAESTETETTVFPSTSSPRTTKRGRGLLDGARVHEVQHLPAPAGSAAAPPGPSAPVQRDRIRDVRVHRGTFDRSRLAVHPVAALHHSRLCLRWRRADALRGRAGGQAVAGHPGLRSRHPAADRCCRGRGQRRRQLTPTGFLVRKGPHRPLRTVEPLDRSTARERSAADGRKSHEASGSTSGRTTALTHGRQRTKASASPGPVLTAIPEPCRPAHPGRRASVRARAASMQPDRLSSPSPNGSIPRSTRLDRQENHAQST